MSWFCFVVTKQRNVELPSKKFKIFNSLDDCLKLNPDIGFVTNESNLHIKTAIKLAKAGCDLFIEKPLSHNSVGLKQLSKIVSEKKLITLSPFILWPIYLVLKKLTKFFYFFKNYIVDTSVYDKSNNFNNKVKIDIDKNFKTKGEKFLRSIGISKKDKLLKSV